MNSKETVIRIILLALLLYSVVSFASVKLELRNAAAEEYVLTQQLGKLENENTQLRQTLEADRSAEEIEQLARQRLGLVMPGEKIFYFTDRKG